MKPIRTILALLLTAGVTAACGTDAAAPADGSGPVDVTYIADLSGPGAAYGKRYVEGVQYQVDQINKAGGAGGHRIELSVVDSGTDQKQGLAAMTSAARGSADVVMYAPLGNLALAMAPVAQQNGVPFIVGQAASKGITETGDHVYRITMSDIHYWEPMLKRMHDREGVTSVAIVYAADNNSTTEAAALIPELGAKLGVRVTESVAIKSADVDFATPAARVLAGNPDAVVVLAVGPGNSSIITALRQRGYAGKFFGGVNVQGGVLGPAGDAAKGTFVATSFVAAEQLPWASGTAFSAEYTAATGSAPDNFIAGGHDQFVFLQKAVESLGTGAVDRESINGALAKVAAEGFPGAAGDPIVFKDRNALTPGVVGVWDGTKFVLAPDQGAGLFDPTTS
ncbi:ABC transporter substrate-binding protein [Pseudonocardia xishanensis]|uniref:ABC transporter substrate-binding protein n=1 Tax=Pseudonocardia xishanensis TaxID=630995 RepID=A0ABP8RWA0_9PSEU